MSHNRDHFHRAFVEQDEEYRTDMAYIRRDLEEQQKLYHDLGWLMPAILAALALGAVLIALAMTGAL